MSALGSAKLDDLAVEWTTRLNAEEERFPASEIYGGRGFLEAVAAATILNAPMLIVSAGLGLVRATTRVPAYACTILASAPDSVASRVKDDFTASGWWSLVRNASPFSVAPGEALDDGSGLILAALSEAYIGIISSELLSLPDPVLTRLRLFTRTPACRVAAGLRRYVMPYDDRLDGPDSPIPGTRSDFASRALRHFSTEVVRRGDARATDDHAEAVAGSIQGWRMPAKVERVRHDDAAMLELIRSCWDDPNGRSLRRFRDEFNVACEQGRFRALSGVVRAEQA